MKDTNMQNLLNKLDALEKTCDTFLESISAQSIWNLNFDEAPEPSIDISSADWLIFKNDLQEVTDKLTETPSKKYSDYIQYSQNVIRHPNRVNIEALKASVCILRKHINEPCTEAEPYDVWSYMHPRIITISKSRYMDGYYADAVESAFKEINTRVKHIYLKQTSDERDGADLMKKVFSPNAPILTFEDITTQTGKSVQQGYMEIFSGSITAIRNPKAHENMTITAHQAIQRLILASLLMTKIDEAVAYSHITE